MIFNNIAVADNA